MSSQMPSADTTAFILPGGRVAGGSNVWSVEMSGALAASGCESVLIEHTHLPEHRDEAFLAVPEGVHLLSCGGPRLTEAGPVWTRRFGRMYELVLPAVLIPNWNPAAYAVCAQCARRRPQDLRLIGMIHADAEADYDTAVYYEPIIHTYICVNETIAARLRERIPSRGGDVLARSCPVSVPEWRDRRYGGGDKPLRITYAGRITNHQKRVSLLLRLARDLHGLGVSFRLRIIGRGGAFDTLRSEWEALPDPVRRCVAIEGFLSRDRLCEIWWDTDVTVLVSDSEGTGLSLLEGMACGCVPVATDCSGPAEVIREPETGLLAPIEDMRTMAEKMARLARDPDTLAVMGAQAREDVQARYSMGAYLPWFREVLRDIREKPDRPWPRGKNVSMPGGRGKKNLIRRGAGKIARMVTG